MRKKVETLLWQLCVYCDIDCYVQQCAHLDDLCKRIQIHRTFYFFAVHDWHRLVEVGRMPRGKLSYR